MVPTPGIPTDTPLPVVLFAASQLVVVVVPTTVSLPGTSAVPLVYAAEALLLVALGYTLISRAPGPTFGPYLLALVGLGGFAVLGWLVGGSLWTAALVLVLGGTVAGYGLHRYERVTLGLVGGESA